jgi:hypothetical protein
MVEGAAPPPPPGFGTTAGVVPAAAPAERKTMSVLAMLALAAVVCIIVFLGIMLPAQGKNQAVQDGYRFGRTFGALFVPGLIAYVTAGRKKVRKPNQFALIFCLVGIVVIGGSAMSSLNVGHPETPEQHLGRLMREAAGLQPARNSIFPGQRRTDDTFRDEFRALVQTNRRYSETVSKMDVSQIKNINTAESFADPALAAGGVRQLHALFDVDSAQEAKVNEILANLRRALESSARSASERESLLKGFDKGMAEQLSKRTSLVAAEKAWIDAVDEEYTYTNQHASNLRVQNGHLVIPDASVREAFNSRMDTQEVRRNEFVRAQKEFQQFQGQTLEKMGVKPQDVGANQR